MIAKKISFTFILLANIILLAHAIIPHHHHEDENSLIDIKSNIIHNHSDSDSDNNHEHNGKNDSRCCILNQTIVTPLNNIKQCCKSLEFHNGDAHFLQYLDNHINTKYDFFVTNFERNPIPPLIFSYTQIVNSLLGLRAPPIV